MAVPLVTTQDASSVTRTGATLNGTVITGTPITRRGFEYNTTQATGDRFKYEDGSFGNVSYALTITGLTPGQTYFVRAHATNADGTGYGGWVSFVCLSATYNVSIEGVDRTADVRAKTLRIDDVINDKANTCSFILDDLHSLGIPNPEDEVIITLDDGTKLFGGTIHSIGYTDVTDGGGERLLAIQCTDYTRLLDRNLVHKSYESMTDKAIIEDIVATYCIGSGITTTNVNVGFTIDQISFNYLQPSQCLRKISEMAGRNWYIDYDKDIHYFALDEGEAAPIAAIDGSTVVKNLELSRNASQLKNRVYVRGGTKLSDYTTYVELGDGQKRKFVLPDKPHDVTIEVDTGSGYVTKTVGIKNVDLTGFDWYLNFQEKYLEQDSGGSVLTSAHKLRVTYKYDIPILVAVEDHASILEYGQREFVIFDKSITTTQAARDRASAELIDYAETLVEGAFETWETGLHSGQSIYVTVADAGITNQQYLIQKVTASAIGSGHYKYKVSIASAKTIGIIKFLIKLLEANKNLIELDDDEVIDELFSVQDSLLSDSIVDSLTIDSAGPYATWCPDSLTSSPSTRARWGLFQWG